MSGNEEKKITLVSTGAKKIQSTAEKMAAYLREREIGNVCVPFAPKKIIAIVPK